MRKLYVSTMASVAVIGTAFAASLGGLGGSSAGSGSDAVNVVSGGSGGGTSPSGASGSTTAAQAAAGETGCRTTSSYRPWGDLGFRTWTPNNSQPNVNTSANAGVRTGAAFSARLVQAIGFDTEFSKETVILEMPDGCLRQYQSASFNGTDRGYIYQQFTSHPWPADNINYAQSVTLEGNVTQAQVDSGQVKTYTSQHFNIMYGTATGNFSYTYAASRGQTWAQFLQAAAKTLEESWQLVRQTTAAPMPYSSGANAKKINVYICGTGLPFIANGDNSDCGASAAAAVYASSVYLQPGSTAITHEFGHTVQFYTGGFRDKAEAGPIWETGANWVSFATTPTVDNGIFFYYSNLENGPLWSNARYGTFSFMTYLHEKDNTRGLLWAPWIGNVRTSTGASTEDFVEAFVRIAKAQNVYPNGYVDFADDMGWYGARMATGDLWAQKSFLDLQVTSNVAKLYAPLATTNTASVFSSPSARPLLQWGFHIVPLTPSASGGTVTATVTGTTSVNSAAWRYAVVTLGSDGTPRYSDLGRSVGTSAGGAVSLTAQSGTKMFLVVTATPYAYQSLGWQQAGAVTGNKFPYTVKITGATPLTGSTATCNSVPAGQQGRDFNYNTNGNNNDGVAC